MNALLQLAILQELINVEERYNINLERRRLRDASNPFELANATFVKYFRVSKNICSQLIERLRPHMVRQRSTGIALENKVITVMYFLGHGSYQKCTGSSFHMPLEQSTFSKILSEVTDVMVEHLLFDFIKFPENEQEKDRIKQRFNEKFNFPGIIGVIDCTHVAIVAPRGDDHVRPGLAYYNRKGYYSINVQVICDADLRVLNCNARYPGSVHDAAIWSLSPVRRHLLNNFTNGEPESSWLIGDSGYPLEPWLLTPVENAIAGSPEEQYTRAHISARNTIERCFGVLKARFRCLLKHRTLHYNPIRASKIIYCCIIIHNMLCDEAINDEHYDFVEEEDVNQRENNLHEDNWLAQGRIVRNRIIRRYFQD